MAAGTLNSDGAGAGALYTGPLSFSFSSPASLPFSMSEPCSNCRRKEVAIPRAPSTIKAMRAAVEKVSAASKHSVAPPNFAVRQNKHSPFPSSGWYEFAEQRIHSLCPCGP
eukprot:CAMPEP_0171748120 /NCGR_PEP_ID=MMETSP0991-20121206/39905_1 /TAXON_ID=483369 /ORGANISM="non described non described, Strain CCMP2098" /LENGTH=110 /DNA_ID=CAMNT_0012348399 /DNA_START=425 /DNA_END=757 /DNA_ORIENTATION=-